MEKKELRKKYKEVRGAIPRRERILKSGIICQNLLSSQEYKGCSKVFVYASAGTEADTTEIITRAIEQGKLVAVPKMTDKPHQMIFQEITSLYELTESRYGIAEPVYDPSRQAVPDKSTLIVLPLLAFDHRGNRLGYGGGYYDAYLSSHTYMAAVGIAYREQECQSIPTEPNDVRADKIITD